MTVEKASSKRAGGFTLLEVVVALTVVSVAVTVLVSVFGASLTLSRNARDRAVALEVAQTTLNEIVRFPAHFVWDRQAGDAASFPVRLQGEPPPGGHPVSPPDVLYPTEAARQRAENRYARFRWTAFARISEPGAAAYEVTVLVNISGADRNRTLSLTTLVPAAGVDALRGGAP